MILSILKMTSIFEKYSLDQYLENLYIRYI